MKDRQAGEQCASEQQQPIVAYNSHLTSATAARKEMRGVYICCKLHELGCTLMQCAAMLCYVISRCVFLRELGLF